jgi:putative flippase GtrA
MLQKQFLVYVMVGVLCALIDIGAMQLLLNMGLHYGLATSVGFALGLIVNYLSHAKFTFNAERSKTSMVRYGVLVLANYGLTLAFVIATEHWRDSPLLGKVISLPVIAINGFIWSRLWVFKPSETR